MLLLAALGLSPPIPQPPPVQLVDLQAFPPAAMARENWSFALGHVNYVKEQMEFARSRGGQWWAWREDAVSCFRAWELLDDAYCLEGDKCRLDQLSRLRDLLGPQNYYAGRMPPPVPVWRFRRID